MCSFVGGVLTCLKLGSVLVGLIELGGGRRIFLESQRSRKFCCFFLKTGIEVVPDKSMHEAFCVY